MCVAISVHHMIDIVYCGLYGGEVSLIGHVQ